MDVTVKQGSLTQVPCDVLIVNLFEGVTQPGGGTGAVDKALDGAISSLIATEKFEGKLGKTAEITPLGKIPAKKVIIVGLGKSSDFTLDRLRIASAAAASRACALKAKTAATILHGAGIAGLDPKDCSRALVEGAKMGTWEFLRYKSSDSKPCPLETIEIIEHDSEKIAPASEGVRIGNIFAEAVIFARNLVTEPSNIATPTFIAETAKKIADETGLECRIIDREEAKRLGMNTFLAVSSGSSEPPTFSVLKYTCPGASRTVAIVGKGITFDSGGLDLKPRESMSSMKEDMAGGAAVLAAMRAIPSLKPNVNVIGVVPATENMVSGSSVKPGDVVTSFSGKTVEINDTDAEGRLILADAVAFAAKEGAQEIIDVATLTGGCVIALGRGYIGIMGNNQELVDRLMAAADKAGERMWQLPMPDDYQEMLKSDIADLKNHPGREASPIMGGMFIGNFVGDVPWAHLDIAGPSLLDSASGYNPKGGTGAGTRTLLQYISQY